MENDEVNRESNVADGLEDSSEVVVKNLQYEPPAGESEEQKSSFIKQDESQREQRYLPQKSLQGNSFINYE